MKIKNPKSIITIAGKLGISKRYLELYGNDKAKVSWNCCERSPAKKPTT